MTIAAAYLTSEGIVFGADSTTTVISQKNHGVVQLLNYAQKIFEVGENSRLALCTWGAGSIGSVSHRTLVAKLANELDLSKVKVRDAAEAFIRIVSKEYGDGKSTGYVGYVLGGWDPDTHIPECYQFGYDVSTPPVLNAFTIGQASFFGCPEFFARVFYGFDSRLPENILVELKKMNLGVSDDVLSKSFQQAFINASDPLRAIGFADLPIREAIDHVHTYLHITIKGFKFRFGPPLCGGPIEIAFISSDRKFRWAVHKDFTRAIYEQE